MSRHTNPPRIVTRRDTLKVVLVPAGAALASRWLIGCSSEAPAATPGADTSTPVAGHGTSAQPSMQPAAGSKAAGAGTSASGTVAGTTASSSGVAGRASAAGSGSGGTPVTGGSSTAGAQASAAMGGSSGGAAITGGSSGGAAITAGSSAGAGGMISAGTGAIAGPGVMWATGGTKSMSGNYPDPFSGSMLGSACKIYPAQTIGPCYAQGPMARSDISDGLGGLPVRLSFLVVKGDCTPVPNASLDIWHSGSQGIYSAYATGTVCNPGMDNVQMLMFCRGVQTTNESGRCEFSTVFPGWYQGRTIHIHFTVRVGGREYVTSQLYFEDALTDEILAQGDYKARGKRDTTNNSDMIFKSGNATADQVLFKTAKRPDGALHAWKVLSIGS